MVDPPAAARLSVRIVRWSFETKEPAKPEQKTARRRLLVEHISGLHGSQVVGGESSGKRCRVYVESARPIRVDSAQEHAAEWPWYVRGSFAADRSR